MPAQTCTDGNILGDLVALGHPTDQAWSPGMQYSTECHGKTLAHVCIRRTYTVVHTLCIAQERQTSEMTA